MGVDTRITHPFRGFAPADYEERLRWETRELKEHQAETAVLIEQHQRGDCSFRTTLESLISLASRAADIFEGSKTDEKRQLLAFVFSNLKLRGKKLEFSMRSPVDLMLGLRTIRVGWPFWIQFEPGGSPRSSQCMGPSVPLWLWLEASPWGGAEPGDLRGARLFDTDVAGATRSRVLIQCDKHGCDCRPAAGES